MATAAKRRAFRKFQLPAVASLEQFQVSFIVAVVAKVVAIVTSVTHDYVGMFPGNNQVVFVIEPQRRRFIPFVTGVTIEI
jgi:hypothetical protein